MQIPRQRICGISLPTRKTYAIDIYIADLFKFWKTLIESQSNEVKFNIVWRYAISNFFYSNLRSTDKSRVVNEGEYEDAFCHIYL